MCGCVSCSKFNKCIFLRIIHSLLQEKLCFAALQWLSFFKGFDFAKSCLKTFAYLFNAEHGRTHHNMILEYIALDDIADLSIKARPEIELFYPVVAHLALRGFPLNTA